ncbi:MAG: biotin/lipoyl-binding protein, partial [Zoogloeaceae bacterium]|nr:biotin/lipoyl-binding protein [Zoogloeaceae bacterium]
MTPCKTVLFLLLSLLYLNGCGDGQQGEFQGYIEGEYVYLSSSQAGRLETLSTGRGAAVEAGSVLFELEAEYERQALHQAEQA